MPDRMFDLNIEKILEDWENSHALREVISNALDERLLSESDEIRIFKDRQGKWHVRDFGRGLRYEHLTQKENEEKLKNPHVVGKFGIGLKDALATFERKGIRVLIRSKFGDITLAKSEKYGFKDVVTLHARVSPPSDPTTVGTEFVFEGLKDEDVAKAKDLFLKFSGERLIEDTKLGQVLEKKGETARIYINGVKAAEEENFLFSYNITSLTQAIRRALNRERSNVGRTAYSDRVKSMLVSCNSAFVAEGLVEDLKGYETGEIHDELKWIEVQRRAIQILNTKKRVVFLTPDELAGEAMMVDEARKAGYEIVAIPRNLKQQIQGTKDLAGGLVRDLGQFHIEYMASFQFSFVRPQDLRQTEKRIFDLTGDVFRLIGGRPKMVKEVKISETMRRELGSFVEAEGVWEETGGRIIIKRSALRGAESYVGALLHEVAHALSGAEDVSREFESELTRLIGIAGVKGLTG